MIKIFHNSKIACQHCAWFDIKPPRYKFDYETIDISQPDNEKEYEKAENVLMEQQESSDVLPYVIIDDTYGFAGFPPPKEEYQVLEYIQRVKK